MCADMQWLSLDSALKELGKLNTGTENRKKAQHKSTSTSTGILNGSTPITKPSMKFTPVSNTSDSVKQSDEGSCSKEYRMGSCNILQLNTQYVTGVIMPRDLNPAPVRNRRIHNVRLGAPYAARNMRIKRVRTCSENDNDFNVRLPTLEKPLEKNIVKNERVYRSKSMEDLCTGTPGGDEGKIAKGFRSSTLSQILEMDTVAQKIKGLSVQ